MLSGLKLFRQKIHIIFIQIKKNQMLETVKNISTTCLEKKITLFGFHGKLP